MFGQFDNIRQLAQFVSYYSSILGTHTFTFYLLDVSSRIKAFLARLQAGSDKWGLHVEVVRWELEPHMKEWSVLWDYGSLLALTDCVYRSMSNYGYAYIADLDEFIVPRVDLAHPGTTSLISKIQELKHPPTNKSTDAFIFKNTFFCSEFNEEIDF